MTAEHDKKRTAQHVDRLMARLKAAERERDELRVKVEALRAVFNGGVSHIWQGGCPDYDEPLSRDPKCPACIVIGSASPAMADQCSCDQRGIGAPGVSCGDCPRDYGSKA